MRFTYRLSLATGFCVAYTGGIPHHAIAQDIVQIRERMENVTNATTVGMKLI
ncbi:hypothetical protein BPIT_26390 [Candidatus Brocadia pituitae]|nr:hypothetical protein BPIT_26390 [Candidatus Brocadia pituitae]